MTCSMSFEKVNNTIVLPATWNWCLEFLVPVVGENEVKEERYPEMLDSKQMGKDPDPYSRKRDG